MSSFQLHADPVCVVGASCRLPGGVLRPEALWPVLNQNFTQASSRPPPPSRDFSSYFSHSRHHNPLHRGELKGHWLGPEGVEQFDASFFAISDSEATTLRPNIRLGLELTQEALEHAGIPPSSLRGKRVAVIVGVGTEDGWDMKRWKDSGSAAFDHNWASSSDPSGVAGHISHFFDFTGVSNTVSNACATGTFALDQGIHALHHGGVDVAVVGAIATHFTPAALSWAVATKVASVSGRSSAFSPEADGYSPAEGAVFLVLKKLGAAKSAGDPIHGIIRGIALGHNGATRGLMTPNLRVQIQVAEKALLNGGIDAEDIVLVEAHGTGTPVGDAIEAEGVRSVYGSRKGRPLILSSSKTVMGHTHGAAALVGLLKVLACFQHREAPPHNVTPHSEFLSGPVVIPTEKVALGAARLVAQVNAFGFTGSVTSFVVEEGSLIAPRGDGVDTPSEKASRFLLPFSAKSASALRTQIEDVCVWAIEHDCSPLQLASILSVCRDHYRHRRAFIVRDKSDLHALRSSESLIVETLPDDGAPLALLNLENLSPDTLAIGAFDAAALEGLLKGGGGVLEAARSLYELGHPLNFGAVYSKASVDTSYLHSFPLSHFERRLHWPTPCTIGSPSTPPTKASGETFDQLAFEKLVAEYGAPFECIPERKPSRQGPPRCFLLTGANGMLGSMLLDRLLRDDGNRVYCVIRGDARSRIQQSFTRHRLDLDSLEKALSQGSLVLMSSDDICNRNLGLSDAEYASVSDNIEEVVHAAWTVNFNLPLVEFHPMLRVTRSLAELCIKSKKLVRYSFIGSYASTFNYPEDLVPERALHPTLSHSLAQGYAISKWVAEHALLLIHKASLQAFHLSIIRVGQICGDTRTGDWSLNEMMPMMIASLPALKTLPLVFPPVSWIPSNVCADALLGAIASESKMDPQFIHLANPTITPWGEVAHAMGKVAGVDSLRLVSLAEYISTIEQSPATPVSRLLPYLTSSLETKTMPDRYSSLCVKASLTVSESLASCPPIGAKLIDLMVNAALRNGSHLMSPGLKEATAIFIFGPWTLDSCRSNATVQRLMAVASQRHPDCIDSVLFPGSPLEQQLHVLGNQLSAVQDLVGAGRRPIAVLGYCLGEYAAAITAGIIMEEHAVDLLVRRAAAMVGIRGQMMNVFCSISDVRRHLSTLQRPPSIGIHAGPAHVVLSGSDSEILSAQEVFLRHQIKFLMTVGSIPFHSTLMDGPARAFRLPTYAPVDSEIAFISGITSTAVRGSALKAAYWSRHLRHSIDFYGALIHAHRLFPDAAFVDLGPGQVMTKMIRRYGSDHQFTVLAPGKALVSRETNRRHPQASTTLKVKVELESRTSTRTWPSCGEDSDDSVKRLCEAALMLLEELFGYAPSSDLLKRSLHSMGLQSMDFIRFSDYFEGRTGVKVPLSAYVSDTSLGQIIEVARNKVVVS